MNDGEERMQLIDAKPVEIEAEPFFNAEVDTAFLLFTRNNPTVGQRITWTAGSISGSHFNAAHPVRLLIHGFNSGPSSGVNIASTREYLALGTFNVIV
jgi:pancreatic triacylglycerol lipase